MKILRWMADNILFVFTLFLLVFIPLYPKLPILDIKNTWVYIRAEDFVVVFVLFVWMVLLLRRKITLKTPITLPVLIFWIIGAIATIHGVLLIFPEVANVFPNVAFLSFLRRIEYLSLFFVAFAGMKDKRFLPYIVAVLTVTLFFVVVYGIGQKYLGFPAYLTMNEEFAKGIPIQLSALSRVPSTFGGHYDAAAYLVLIVPILTSMVFGFRNWFVRLLLLTAVSLGFVLLFMTVSRVSFFVLLITLVLVLFFQKKRFIIFSLPVLAFLAFLFLSSTPTLLERFGSTIKEIDVLVDASSGEAIGHIKVVPSEYFENKLIKRKIFKSKDQLSTVGADEKYSVEATPSAILPYSALPPQVVLVAPPNIPTGEDLPQGTGYINLTLSPVTKKLGEFFYKNPDDSVATDSKEAFVFHGDFLIKRASAYDLSFTTRFQGEWPKALAALKKNILFGSGYSSLGLAVDNNYLRLLGEIGLLGFASFFAIFVICGIYISKVLPKVDSPIVRSFVLGFSAGVLGLMLNAVFIDVFEASKIAFLLWLLTGVTLGLLHFYQDTYIDLYKEFKNIVSSAYAFILYLLIATVVVFSPMVGNFFVGDDFTWFRWAADCSNGCPTVFRYLLDSDGFFYRPGTKVYFGLMYSVFWLNQIVYHLVSIFLHFIVAVLLFLIAKKILRETLLPVLAAFLFLILSGYSESVFWTAATGHLFNAMFILLSLLFFILWEDRKKTFYFVASLLSIILGLLFHELGVVAPLFIVLYKFVTDETFTFRIFKKLHYILLFLPVLPYLLVRYVAQSHWLSGDYNYNLLNLPYNIVGNAIGYLMLVLFGPISLPFYQALRNFSREYIVFAIVAALAVVFMLVMLYRMVIQRMEKEDRRVVIFTMLFFIVALLPFLGLGNIASRYSYLASIGLILLFVFFVKKIYSFLLNNGQSVALAAVTSLVTLFCLLHIIQIQQIHSDWYEAGKKTERFFIAIDGLYADYWAEEPMEFYFVNTPIRTGEAWVFPVGIKDALWLVFRNPDIRVNQSESVEQALNVISDSVNEKVFEFDESGRVIERKKMLQVQPNTP